MWTGRCEAYWHGTLHHTRIDEWDMQQAYPRIAERHDVPTTLLKPLLPGADVQALIVYGGYAVLAEVTVSTVEPLVPAERDGYILWPTGTFRTTLWDPELLLLYERGATVTVHRGWLYRAEPALAEWARWVLNRLDAPDAQVPAWQKAILRHWSTAVVGRAAMQHQEWEVLATTRRSGCRWSTMRDLQTGEACDLVHIGHTLWQSTGVVDWAHGCPQVTGWVMSMCRVILTRLWLEAGHRVALYADTDSLLVEGRHYDLMAALARRHPQWRVRLKRSWDRITIHGPRQIMTGEKVRVSGVPSKARRLPNGELVGEVWESLRGALRQGRPTRVKVTPRRWKLSGVERRRVVGADGWTEPVHIGG